MYSLKHDDKDNITPSYLLTVSIVILDCVPNCKLCYINKKKKVPTTLVIVLLMNTSPVTLITEHIIGPPPVPVLASIDSACTTSHLIQTWSMKFLLKQLLDSHNHY